MVLLDLQAMESASTTELGPEFGASDGSLVSLLICPEGGGGDD
ncbi:SapB/AmfS family lanthipeptide [Streptomyces rectiverticillatus]